MRKALMLVVAALALAGCGEPEPDVALPARDDGAHVADLAAVFSESEHAELEDHLRGIAADGRDIVALTFETDNANCGEAYRAAKDFVAHWGADVALVAVAAPGDFASTDETRTRCLGVQPLEDRAVAGSVRERIAETLVPPKTAENDWLGAFVVAADELAVP